MKKIFLLAAFTYLFSHDLTGQIICIYCYNQNDSISSGVNNLLLNGGFENGCGVNGIFCPASSNYTCNITSWTCTGGGSGSYAQTFDGSTSQVVEGSKVLYFGNAFCRACSATTNDTSCLINLDCTVTGVPDGYPKNLANYGGATGISLQQTVSGLTVGNTYVLEFWAGGEDYNAPLGNGLFAVDVGFGDTLLRCKPTAPGKIGTTFIIEFNATSASHTIKFTNWGHIAYSCTELILDAARLYTLAELSSSVPSCGGLTSSNSFQASDTSVCQKFCVDFYDSSTNNPTAWQWNFEGGSPSFSTDQNPINICYNTPGTYDVTLITSNANGNDTVTLSNYITVYATASIPTITQNGNILTSSAASSYQWQLNSVDIAGATNQSYTVTQTGLYIVIVSDSNGCVNSASQNVVISGVNEVNDKFNVLIYPNPSGGKFMVELLNGQMAGEYSIQVENTLGQIVFSSHEIFSSAKKEIDLHSLTPGSYFIEISEWIPSGKTDVGWNAFRKIEIEK